MKKVLLSSVAALAVFAAAAPVFAQGENANSSNQLIQKKYVSWRDAADEAQRQIEAHAADIKAEAEENVSKTYVYSNLEAAKRALASFSASSSDVRFVDGKPVYGPTVKPGYNGTNPQESDVEFQGGNSQDAAAAREQLQANVDAAQKAYDKALSAELTTLTNKYRKQYEENYIKAAKAQGNYYNETGVEANRTNAQRIADDYKAQTGKDATVTTDEKGNIVVKDEKGNVIATVDKNGNTVQAKDVKNAKGGKTLPKTSAVK